MNKQKLIDFETDIAACFNNAQIKAPIHLYSNNEEQLIEIFKDIKPDDWVFCTWRSHYQCLLKGVPPKQVKKDCAILLIIYILQLLLQGIFL